MNVTFLNTYVSSGGAARAAVRLAESLRLKHINLTYLSRQTYPDSRVPDNSKHIGWLRGYIDYIPTKLYPKRQKHNFSRNWVPSGLLKYIKESVPDILHAHWVGDGFLRIEDFSFINAPIVWTLHDSWAFTGGCYLPGDCTRYESECAYCPVLGSSRKKDLAYTTFYRKMKSYRPSKMTIVAPSHWMAKKVEKSSLLNKCRVEVIANGVDTKLFSPGEKELERNYFNIPNNKTLLMFGAQNSLGNMNKGFDLLKEAVTSFPEELKKRCCLVIVGADSGSRQTFNGIEILSLGTLKEKDMARAYRASDVFVLPSRQENLPNMIAEALSSGIPGVAFDVGGVSDLIQDGSNGCLVPPFDVNLLSESLCDLIENQQKRIEFGVNGRNHVIKHFSLEQCCDKYLSLYKQLVHLSGV